MVRPIGAAAETDRALIGVSADCKTLDGSVSHAVGDKYLRAVAEVANATPLIIPALSEFLALRPLLQRLDGVLLTGSVSNVHPRHYGTDAGPAHPPFDPARDALTLALIAEALALKLPLLAICRGFQELNVALGGTLHPALHRLSGRADHRRPEAADRDIQYGPRHPVRFIAAGRFARLFSETQIMVNSLHHQGIDRLASGLTAEGVAPDGTIEAVSVTAAEGFALGVQWHPEYKASENPFSVKLFEAFGNAARARLRQRAAAAAIAGGSSAAVRGYGSL